MTSPGDPAEPAAPAPDECNERFRLVADDIPIVLWHSGPDGGIRFTNRRWYDLTGWTPDATAGFGWSATLHPLDRERVLREYLQAIEYRQVFTIQGRVRHARGHDLHLLACGAPRYSPDGVYRGHVGAAVDVTDKALAREALAFQKTLLECQGEASLEGTVVVSPDRRVLYFNSRFRAIWNVAVGVGDDARPVLAMIAGRTTDPRGFLERTEAIYAHPDALGRDEVTLRDGRVIDRYTAPVVDTHGTCYGRAWFLREITVHRRIERELRSREMTLRSFYDSAPMCMGVVEPLDGDVRILSCNRATAETTGRTVEEMRDILSSELGVPRPSLEFWCERYAESARLQAPVRFEFIERARPGGRHEPGTERWFSATVCPIEAPADYPPRFCYVVDDVTERRVAENRLRRYESMVAASSDGMAWLDARGVPVTVNDAFREMFDSLTGGDGGLFRDAAAAGAGQLGLALAQCRSQRRPAGVVLVVPGPGVARSATDAAGQAPVAEETRFVDIRIHPCPGADDELAGFVVSARDVSERMRIEERVRESRDRLRRLMARAHLVREEERTRIARELHDEFGQVLSSFKIDLSWLLARQSVVDAEARSRLAALIPRVDDLLDGMRRIAAGLRPAVLDALGLEAAIESEAAELATHMSLRELRLELDEDPAPADPSRDTAVFRIFQEAMTNVMRHAEATAVAVRLSRRGNRLQLQVEDDGRGVTAEEIGSSTSLGIIGMRERAGAFGGRVVIRGRPGGGTVVTLEMPLPVARGEAAR